MKQLSPIIALISVCIATVLHWQFSFLIHPYIWLLFFPAIFVCAWFGGFWYSLVSLFLTLGLGCYLFIDLKYLIPILVVKIYLILLFLLIPGAYYFWRMKKSMEKRINELMSENLTLKQKNTMLEEKINLNLEDSN